MVKSKWFSCDFSQGKNRKASQPTGIYMRNLLKPTLHMCWEDRCIYRNSVSYPVLRRRYTQMRDMRILSSLWKSRVELSRGTKNDETKRESRVWKARGKIREWETFWKTDNVIFSLSTVQLRKRWFILDNSGTDAKHRFISYIWLKWQ